LQGIIVLTLTATLDTLRPQPCDSNGSSICAPPSSVQYAVLYTGLALACIGSGGTRFTLATMGANQFDNPKHQGIFFNWYFVSVYAASALSNAIVYIEDNVGWKWGYGVSAVANLIGLAAFLLGHRFYLRDKPQGSPFTGLVRVVVAAVRKRKVQLSSKIEDYYYGKDGMTEILTPPKKRFR
jgi:peptide/histidine transporter 3/4